MIWKSFLPAKSFYFHFVASPTHCSHSLLLLIYSFLSPTYSIFDSLISDQPNTQLPNHTPNNSIHSLINNRSTNLASPLTHHSLTTILTTHSPLTHHSLITNSPLTHHSLITNSPLTRHSLTTHSLTHLLLHSPLTPD